MGKTQDPQQAADQLNAKLNKLRDQVDLDTNIVVTSMTDLFFGATKTLQALGIIENKPLVKNNAWWISPDRVVTAQDIRETRAVTNLGLSAADMADPKARKRALELFQERQASKADAASNRRELRRRAETIAGLQSQLDDARAIVREEILDELRNHLAK